MCLWRINVVQKHYVQVNKRISTKQFEFLQLHFCTIDFSEMSFFDHTLGRFTNATFGAPPLTLAQR